MNFNPREDLGIDEEARLVVYDIREGNFFEIRVIEKGGSVQLNDPRLINEPWNFKYKYQLQRSGRWTDVTKYMLIEKDDIFEEVLLEKKQILNNPKDLVYILSNLERKSDSILSNNLHKSVSMFMRYLWKQTKYVHRNAELLVSALKEKYGYTESYLGNVIFYIDMYLKIKKDFIENSANDKYFNALYNSQNKGLYSALENYVEECDKYSLNIQMANMIAGKLLSFLGNRVGAIERFEKIRNFNDDFVMKLKIDQGVYTYTGLEASKYDERNQIRFLSSTVPTRPLTLLVSLDTNFLRLYGVNILFTASVLKKYHFHLHVIGERAEAEKLIEETVELFDVINNYRKVVSPVVAPTFSTEEVPDNIPDAKTYYACSRYIHADTFMDHFSSDLYILDADLFFSDDPGDYFDKLAKHDISLPFSRGVQCLCPWRRILAGNVYLKNNLLSRQFVRIVSDYILQNIRKDVSWTLDQNALTYAYEEFIKLGKAEYINNLATLVRPTQQPQIRRQIEVI